MATTPDAAAYCLDEAKLTSLRELVQQDGAVAEVDRGLEEGFRTLLSMAAALQDAERLSPESWDWAEGLEAKARWAAERFREDADDIRLAVAALSLRPGAEEEAFVEALRRQAAFADARRADAEQLFAATRRLQEKELRRLAALEHLVDPDMPGFLGYVAEETDSSIEGGYVPTAEEMAVAAEVEEAAARKEERLTRMADRLRRGATAAADLAGEEALVAALRRQAANADAARSTVEAFAASVRRFRAAGSSRGPATAGEPTQEAFLTIYIILVASIVP